MTVITWYCFFPRTERVGKTRDTRRFGLEDGLEHCFSSLCNERFHSRKSQFAWSSRRNNSLDLGQWGTASHRRPIPVYCQGELAGPNHTPNRRRRPFHSRRSHCCKPFRYSSDKDTVERLMIAQGSGPL
jgi:hypothetical protein